MNGILIWDFDGTLAIRTGGWSGALRAVIAAERPDLQVSSEGLRTHLKTGFPWHTPEIVRAPMAPEVWWESLRPVFAGALTTVAGLPERDADRLAALVRGAYLNPEYWQLFDDVTATLECLRELGWKHVVLSNHVPELSTLIDALGLAPLIGASFSSGCTGCEKPNPAAFDCVFETYPDARSGWMIGDSFTADVLGAVRVGMSAILVRNRHPEARYQCDTLAHALLLIVRESLRDEPQQTA